MGRSIHDRRAMRKSPTPSSSSAARCASMVACRTASSWSAAMSTSDRRRDVRGDVVVVGGRLTRAEGSQLRGSVSDITFGDWWQQAFGSVYLPRLDFGGFGQWLGFFGAAFRISMLAIVMGFVLLIARAPVARIGRAAGAEPIRAFFLGLAAEILFLPALIVACVGLIVTIIGIPLVAVARAGRAVHAVRRADARLHRDGVPRRRVARGSTGLARSQRVSGDGGRSAPDRRPDAALANAGLGAVPASLGGVRAAALGRCCSSTSSGRSASAPP